MKLKSIMAGAALGFLALTAAPERGTPGFIASARADVNFSVGIFYDQLGSYGDWVDYRGQYVFIPGRVRYDWRPYTEGHWIYTRLYGWTWVSYEPFGWATYHYGRWGYSDDIGWYWVPGQRWAPAWVSWRRSNDYVVWAPLPPVIQPGVEISIDVNYGDIPDYYWVAVPSQRFLAPDLQVDIINNVAENRNIVRRTEYVGTPQITNNIVVNNVIDVNAISRETGRKIHPVEVRTTDNPASARATANGVTVFQGQLTADKNMRPQKVTNVDQVRKIKRSDAGKNANKPDQNAIGAAPVDTNNASGATGTAQQPGRKRKQPPDQNTLTPDTSGQQQMNQSQGQQPGRKRKQPQDQNTLTPDTSGQQQMNQSQGQQPGRKRKQPQDQNALTPDMSGQQQIDQSQGQQPGRKHMQPQDQNTLTPDMSGQQPGRNRKQPQDQNTSTPDMSGQQQMNQGNGNGRGNGKKNQMPCDPSTGANCAPAQ